MRWSLPALLRRRLRQMSGIIEDELDAFLGAIEEDPNNLPRLDKPCGIDRHGNIVSQLQADLRLRHYRLCSDHDPLLIYQRFDEENIAFLVGVARHNDIFGGNENRWCHQNQNAINWRENEHHLNALNQIFGPLPDGN